MENFELEDKISQLSESDEQIAEVFQSEKDDLLLADANLILSMIRFSSNKKITTIDELKLVASSMFVAIYESIFNTKLNNVVREPQTKEDYMHNAQLVVDGLCQRIHIELQHITGIAIVSGDLTAISDLVSIFIRIANITGRNDGIKAINHIEIARTPMSSVSSENQNSKPKASTTLKSKLQRKKVDKDKVKKTVKLNHGTAPRSISLSTVKDVDLSIAYDGIQNLLKSNESLIRQTEKLDAAKYRRDQGIYFRELSARRLNRQKADRSNRFLQQKKYYELSRQKESFDIRSSNEEYVALRKVYQGLLKRLFNLKNELKDEAKGREEAIKEEIFKYTKSLQSIFEDRVKLYKHEKDETNKNLRADFVDLKKYESSLKFLIKGEYQKLFERSNSNFEQLNRVKKISRHEGYCNILDMLEVEKDWSKSLRRGF